MHRNKETNLRPRSKYFPALLQVDEAAIVAVGKDRNCAQLDDCQGSGESRHRRRKNVVPGSATERLKGYLNRVQTAGDTNRVTHLPLFGEIFFKSIYFAAKNVPAARSHPLHSRQNVRARVLPLTLEIV